MPTDPCIVFALSNAAFGGHRPDSVVTDKSVKGRIRAAKYRMISGNGMPPKDEAKFWDARNVARVLGDLPKNSAILDCGAFNSAPLFWLADQGFSDLHGIDLNPNVVNQPGGRKISYSVQNIEATAYFDNTFDALICSSVIEHGVDWHRFLGEAQRILKPGGYLYLSTDVVNADTESTDVWAFGAPWNPLDPDRLVWAVEALSAHGFDVGELPVVEPPAELPVEFAGKHLGFVAFFGQLAGGEGS